MANTGLSRRSVIRGGAALLSLPALGQQVSRVEYRDYARCLPDHLRMLTREAYERRSAAIRGLTTEAAIRDRQQWVRRTFWEMVGGELQRTPLNARTTNSFEHDGVRVECVVYETQPGLHVSANLYLPTTGKPPYPGILFQAGHSTDGKAYPLYQICCQGLARLGFVVLAFDPMGQGERTYYPGNVPSRTRLPGGADDEHTLPGKQMLLVGDTATRLQTWDAVRSLDYLAAHPLVDSRRLASTGQSGGGTNTMLLAAVDDRLAAAAVACPNTENVAARNFIPPGATDDAEQNFIGSGPLGFDRWDLLYPMAPKPLLVLVSAKDFAGTYSPNYIENGREEYQRLSAVYARLGHLDHLGWHETPLPHGLSYDLRLQIYNWMSRWLLERPQAITEEPVIKPIPEERLRVTKQGNVVVAFGGLTPAALARKGWSAQSARGSSLARVFQPRKPDPQVKAAVVGRTSYRTATLEAIEVQSAPDVFLPAWLYLPMGRTVRQTLLVLDSAGRQSWREGELFHRLAESGFAVCAADIRGFGDLAPELTSGAARYARSHSTEQHYAWASLILGEPLAAQRVTDILSLVQALASRPDLRTAPIAVAARGLLTTPALFTAAFETRIRALLLSGGLISFQEIFEADQFAGGGYFTPPQEANLDVFGSLVPKLLNHTDLPAIAASLAPRQVVIAGPRAASGSVMEPAAAQAIFRTATNVKLLPKPAWDFATLSSLADL